MKLKKSLCTLLLLLSITFSSNAQEGNFWFFGFGAGVDFNSGGPIAITPGAIITTEGCAALSDGSGNLMFYTDGITVYNKLHLAMPNGTGLLGDPSSTQSGIIVPKPGSPNIFYIFTTPATGSATGLRYSEVDMTLAGGLGDVTATKNIFLIGPISEKLTAIKHSNNIDFWVLTNLHMTNQFRAFAVTSAGVTTVPVSSTGGTADGSGLGIGYLKSSTDGSKLVAVHDFITTVDVMNFNQTAGTVSSDFSFATVFSNPYGGEFSPDGTRLYVCSESSSNIYQFNMTLGTSAAIIASGTIIATSACGNLGALQNAPDGKMYVSKYGFTSLGCISNPNALGLACGYTDLGVDLLGKVAELGLPNFIQSFFNAPNINFVNTCLGDSTMFSLADTSLIDSVLWNFGDPASGANNSSTLYSPSHIFTALGTYNVSVVTWSGSVSDTSTAVVTITGVPIVDLGNDTTVCTGVAILLDAGSTPCVWQDLSTSQTFNATTAGTYYVSVTNSCGTTTDTIQVIHVPLPVVVATDVTICAGETANLSASGASTYSWSSGATSTGVNTATASPIITTNYTVTGSVGGCSDTDIASVTVNQLPVPTFTASVSSGCETLCVTFTETGSSTCSSLTYLFGNGASTNISDPTYCYTDAGIYSVSLTCTDANGCTGTITNTNMITVFSQPVASFTISPDELTTPVNTPMTFTNTSVNEDLIFWTFGDPASGSADSSTLNSPTHTYTTEAVYCVQLIAITINGCVDTAEQCVDIAPDIVIPNVFTPNGDGNNDVFHIMDLRLGQGNLTIFNRWGNLMYSSEGYNNDWNGNGIADGVYYYIFVYPVDGKTYTGFVHVFESK